MSKSGPGASSEPSRELGGLGSAASLGALPCGHPGIGHNDGPCCALCEALLEVEVLHATNQRLNRRCQQAESAAARSADSVKAELYGRRKGKPLGRMLANIRLTELEAAADALAKELESLAGLDDCCAIDALVAYRAVRSKDAP